MCVCESTSVYVCVCVCACVHACVRVCVRVCARDLDKRLRLESFFVSY